MTTPTVDVVVPTRDNLAELRACIDSLLAQTVLPAKIIVCVDGSTDGTIEYLEKAQGSAGGASSVVLRTHAGNAHRGRAASRNLALASIESDRVWFVDSDMVLEADALQRHLVASSGESTCTVGIIEYLNATDSIWAGYLNTRGRHRYADRAKLPFAQFTTANSVVPAALLVSVGGFDGRFEAYGGEDIDLALRLQDRGADFVCARHAVAATIEDKDIEMAMSQFKAYGASNLRLLERVHPEAPRTFQLERLESGRLADRAIVAFVNPVTDALARALTPLAPTGLRNMILSYRVVSAVWSGYRTGL